MSAPLARSFARRLAAEFVGSAMLLMTVVGSGIMGERLADGNMALALLANALATGGMLWVLLRALGALSGAHLNPLVSIGDAWGRLLPWRELPGYASAQIAGAFVGVMTAHLMFEEPLLSASTHARSGFAQLCSEFVATFGLVFVIRTVSRFRSEALAGSVAAYVASAYWFTASTAFANPAATLGRMATDTFSGIRPVDAPGFLLAQCAGALAATATCAWLLPGARERTPGPRVHTILFACVHNAGRSQIASAFCNALADPRRARGISAGTRPAERIHPEVARALGEVGLHDAGSRPQLLTAELASTADLLVTLGCGEECPLVPGLARIDWPIDDPKGQSIERVREIREELRARVRALLEERGWSRP